MTAAPIRVTVWVDGEHYRPLYELAQSKGYGDVGELLGRAAPQLLGKPRAPRKPYVRMTPELRARMVELSTLGKSTAEIAGELGISRSSVWNHLNAASTINAETSR